MKNCSKEIKKELLKNGVKVVRCIFRNNKYYIDVLIQYREKTNSVLMGLGLQHVLMTEGVHNNFNGTTVEFNNLVFKKGYEMGNYFVKDDMLGWSLIGKSGDWMKSVTNPVF